LLIADVQAWLVCLTQLFAGNKLIKFVLDSGWAGVVLFEGQWSTSSH